MTALIISVAATVVITSVTYCSWIFNGYDAQGNPRENSPEDGI